jgi:SlyX protein
MKKYNVDPHDWISLIEDLQSRLAFQEDALQFLSDQMAKQDKALREAELHITYLKQKIDTLQPEQSMALFSSSLERPPHY